MTEITFKEEALEKLKTGVDKLANVVKSTLGPGGTNVILQRGDMYAITKDGVSVARQVFQLQDPIENAGAQIVKEAANKTVAEAGDGTTTATVLAQAIFSQGIKLASTGANPIDVKRGIDIAVKNVVQQIRLSAKPVVGNDIQKVSLISANGDKEIGKLVADAITEVGLEGIVTVDESKSLETYSKKVEGLRWDRGFMSPHFINNPSKAECVLVDPVILIYDGNLTSLREIMGGAKANGRDIISKFRNDPELTGKPLLIIANDFGAEAISAFAYNQQKNAINCCLVQAPDFQDTRKAIMYDIAAATGATVITKDSGHTWSNISTDVLGRCESVRVTQWNTTIVEGRGELKATNRVNEIREQMKDANEYALVVLKSRLARMIQGLMVIYVGGGSEVEVQEKKDRIDDALNATRAAIEEGVVQGGAMVYLRAWKKFRTPLKWHDRILLELGVNSGDHGFTNYSQYIGAQVLYESLTKPFEAIVENVGHDPKDVLKNLNKLDPRFGFNAATLEYEDLISSGIIDPAKVVRLALENAASVAGMLLTSQAIINQK